MKLEKSAHAMNLLETIDDRYVSFYCKMRNCRPAKAMNLDAFNLLAESVSKSCIKSKALCVYNPNSWLNLKRANQADTIYLDEKERKTENTSKLIDCLKAYCKNNTVQGITDQ